MLELRNVKKNYNDFSLECTMEVKPGMITGLIGKNGSGKSTTFKSILGIIRIDDGEIKVFGKDVTKLTRQDKEQIGVAFADSGFSNYLTIGQIKKILKASYTNFNEEFFDQWCKQLELPMNKNLKGFSTGMKAKMKVLVALCHEAKLLILDEPTVGLDVIAREQVLEMIRDYMECHEEASIVISSHISSDIESLCDDIYLISGGKILVHEETNVLLDEYGVLKVSKEDYEKLDKQYILCTKEENFGYSCLTNQKSYYVENYPKIVIESGNIDDLIIIMNGGR